jgi:hypothetical protein
MYSSIVSFGMGRGNKKKPLLVPRLRSHNACIVVYRFHLLFCNLPGVSGVWEGKMLCDSVREEISD